MTEIYVWKTVDPVTGDSWLDLLPPFAEAERESTVDDDRWEYNQRGSGDPAYVTIVSVDLDRNRHSEAE